MEDIHPLKDAIDIPFFSPWEWGILLFLLSFLLFRLFSLLWRYFQLQRQKRQENQGIAVIQDKDIWKEGLEKLKKLMEHEQYKEFSHQSTEFLKSYLSLRHQKNITDWTTSEILWFYKSFSKESYESLKTLFRILDPVKFAGQKGTSEKAREAFSVLEKYILTKNKKREQ